MLSGCQDVHFQRCAFPSEGVISGPHFQLQFSASSYTFLLLSLRRLMCPSDCVMKQADVLAASKSQHLAVESACSVVRWVKGSSEKHLAGNAQLLAWPWFLRCVSWARDVLAVSRLTGSPAPPHCARGLSQPDTTPLPKKSHRQSSQPAVRRGREEWDLSLLRNQEQSKTCPSRWVSAALPMLHLVRKRRRDTVASPALRVKKLKSSRSGQAKYLPKGMVCVLPILLQ